jgi:preprotein translocase subunit YajC
MNNLILLMGAPPPGTPNPFVGMLPFLLILVIFYFLLFRPQQKRAQEHRRLLDSLKTGDDVVTESGMFGRIVSVNDDSVVLKVADNVKVKFLKGKIVEKQAALEAAKEAQAKKGKS